MSNLSAEQLEYLAELECRLEKLRARARELINSGVTLYEDGTPKERSELKEIDEELEIIDSEIFNIRFR